MADRRFRVEIAPTAWRALGRLPTESFREVRAQLELIAGELAAAADAGQEVTVTLRDFLVRCSVDAEAGVVTLVDVELRFPDVG